MAHDQKNYVVTRFHGSPTWHAAISTDGLQRKWILYVDNDDVPYVYRRKDDFLDANGDRRENYVWMPLAEGAEPKVLPQAHALTVAVYPSGDAVHPWEAASGGEKARGESRTAAVLELMQNLPEPGPLADPSVAALAL